MILGFYNWTDSGAYDNDNTLIIRDRELAQVYYAEWLRLWSAMDLETMCNANTVYMPVVLQAPPTLPEVQISQIMCDPPGDDVASEFVRIENSGGAPVDMTGWTPSDEIGTTFAFPSFTLPAGGFSFASSMR